MGKMVRFQDVRGGWEPTTTIPGRSVRHCVRGK